jgi:glycosyltransferase involved in cell wall biosynthesis
MKPTITAVIITKNEEEMLANCIETVQWCDTVLVIDNGSEDKTVDIAEKMGATVKKVTTNSFADQRNVALQTVKTDWIFYIDADERVTPQLSQEILVQMETSNAGALTMIRQNMMYGKFFEHGGWSGEKVTRAFRTQSLKKWKGEIHESPEFEGEEVHLHLPLLHFTHRSTIDGLKKTISWTPREAKLLAEAGIAPITVVTIFRKGFMEFFRRAVLKQGSKDGMEGWIEAIIQGINRMLVYIQVWEMQQSPSLKEKYQAKEREILSQWKHQ